MTSGSGAVASVTAADPAAGEGASEAVGALAAEAELPWGVAGDRVVDEVLDDDVGVAEGRFEPAVSVLRGARKRLTAWSTSCVNFLRKFFIKLVVYSLGKTLVVLLEGMCTAAVRTVTRKTFTNSAL